ncbi:MAG: FAD-binding oxidoreductase [Nanoarchaeota archaeon]
MADAAPEENSIDTNYLEVVMAQRDCAPAMKPKSFMTGMIAEGIEKPSNNALLKKVLKKNKCVIRGYGSTFAGSILPHEDETIVFTGNLDSIQIKKKTAIVGGGTPFYKIISEAKKNNLEVPCYPLTYNSATIGGHISNNGLVGLNSRGTGYLFDYIEELEVVTPSGTTYKVRGDDIKDFFGAEGMLGVITSVKLRLIDKETRYIHFYGFDGIEDMLRFLEMNDDVYSFYFLNKHALKLYDEELQLKEMPEYSAIVIDKNWKSDYQKKLRTDLAQMGVSHVFEKDVLRYFFKKIGRLELGLLGRKKSVHVGDGISQIHDCFKVIRLANMNGLPFFGTVGKEEVLYRIYADCGSMLKRQKFMVLMDKMHKFSEPNSAGSFFRDNLKGTPRELRLNESLGKYDTKKSIVPRVQLYPKKNMRVLLGSVFNIFGGRLW